MADVCVDGLHMSFERTAVGGFRKRKKLNEGHASLYTCKSKLFVDAFK